MTLLIYRHSLKKNTNYTELKHASFSYDSDVTGYGMGKELLNGENFAASIKYHSPPFVCVDALRTSQHFFSHVTFFLSTWVEPVGL